MFLCFKKGYVYRYVIYILKNGMFKLFMFKKRGCLCYLCFKKEDVYVIYVLKKGMFILFMF